MAITEALSLRLDRKARVSLYYLLGEVFPKAEYHGDLDGWVGGEEQEVLEEALRKKLAVLKLAPGRTTDAMLKEFVLSAPEDALVALMELMPSVAHQVALSYSSPRQAAERAGIVARRVTTFLRDLGVSARFDAEGSLTPCAAVDATPKVLAELPRQEQLRADINTALGVSHPLALFFIDLDNFKAVNDAKGHQAGDACLLRVAELIGSAVVTKGKVYRYGGDEFCVVLHNFSQEEALATAERIRRAIEDSNPGDSIPVTVSIGVAVSTQEGLSDPEKLLEAADGAMYRAKDAGRNCVVSSTSSVEATAKLGSRLQRLIELADAELEHNMGRTGALTLTLDQRHLEALIDEAENRRWDESKAEVLRLLKDLRARTEAQRTLPPQSASAAHETYRKVAAKVRQTLAALT